VHVVAGHMNPGQLRALPAVYLALSVYECFRSGETILRVF